MQFEVSEKLNVGMPCPSGEGLIKKGRLFNRWERGRIYCWKMPFFSLECWNILAHLFKIRGGTCWTCTLSIKIKTPGLNINPKKKHFDIFLTFCVDRLLLLLTLHFYFQWLQVCYIDSCSFPPIYLCIYVFIWLLSLPFFTPKGSPRQGTIIP